MIVDSDFLNTYGITLNSGRFFEKDRTDNGFEMVLNETAQKNLRIEDPVGKILVNSLFPDNRYPILGVVEDFHFQSLRQQIQPMVFASFAQGETGRYISARIRPENVKETLSYIETAWYKFAKGQAFEYEFFDDHFKRIYLAEERTEVIFLIFSVLAIAIACLGLFGLSAFMTERRIKEVGVRKVLGSSTGSIVLLLIGQFLKWVLIANLIAWPIAWYVMNAWLENFVYKININWWIFPLAGCIVILLSMATVIYQSMKAAFTNPVNVLRYE
jgi:putative ABC transport system permease protein